MTSALGVLIYLGFMVAYLGVFAAAPPDIDAAIMTAPRPALPQAEIAPAAPKVLSLPEK